MWTSFAIAVNLFVCSIVAVPTQNDIAKSFQAAVHQQDLHSILMSIEERLRNLDSIYSLHLSPTLEDKLEQYQRKLESIDTKIIRLESLVMLNLDKISENISTKNFKDDIAKTNLAKKVDAVYEGLSHRLNYVDRKFETSANKIQGKLETTLTRLERMDESFTTRNEEIELELSDAIAAIDELKTSQTAMEENILNNTNENFEISLKEQMSLMQAFSDKSGKAIQTLYENTTRDFDRLEKRTGIGLAAINETDRFLRSLELELKRELNEYAVKVGEMNSENWKTGTALQNKQNQLEIILNSTKAEVQSGLRALMVLIGKTTKDQPQSDQGDIQKLNEKIDSNFEKVFSAQNLFMDSCYRLQMDESQIESKISDILEKLIETFEKKTAVEITDIKNLEKIIKTHDAHISRNLYQANTNVVSIYEKMTKEHKKFENDMKQVGDHLSALFSLIQDSLADENGSLPSKNVNLLLHDLKEMEKKISSLCRQGDVLAGSVQQIEEELQGGRNSTTEIIEEYFGNISRIITGMEAKMNVVYLYYYFNQTKMNSLNQNLSQQLQEVIEMMKDKARNERIEKLIPEIFGTDPETGGGPNLLDIIDVRSGLEYDNATVTETIEMERVSTTIPNKSSDYEVSDDNFQQVSV